MIRLKHIGIYTKDVKAMMEWYCDVLKLKVIRKLDRLGKPPVYFLGNENGFYIELLPTTNDRKERTLEDPGYSHIAIEVDNFTNFSLYLKTKGVIIFGERITSAGWRIAYFKDLEGNIIEIIEK